MSNLREEIKMPTEEEKREVYLNIILNMINSSKIISQEKISKIVEGIESKLSPDEFTAIYNIAVEVKKAIAMPKTNKRLLEFLNVSENCQNDNGNLLKFVNATVNNIEQERRFFPKRKWYLQVGKIFDRMEGKDPYAEEMKFLENRRKNMRLIQGGKNEL